ncbi:hypothetical protein [Flavobacterium sp. GCM10027622]|uniref:hypothetical protein n=1 Tax=unclassified Flavobacterium TaxID=196869 RepID=UPI00360DCAE6
MSNGKLWTLIVVGTLGAGFLIGFINDKLKSNSPETSSEYSTENTCYYISELEDVKTCAIGTWIAKPTGELWKKIIIKADGSYELYEATPQSGSWGASPDRTGSYDFKEDRFSDTGKKYVTVNLHDSGVSDYRIVFDGSNPALELNGNYDVIRKGDKNPWN